MGHTTGKTQVHKKNSKSIFHSWDKISSFIPNNLRNGSRWEKEKGKLALFCFELRLCAKLVVENELKETYCLFSHLLKPCLKFMSNILEIPKSRTLLFIYELMSLFRHSRETSNCWSLWCHCSERKKRYKLWFLFGNNGFYFGTHLIGKHVHRTHGNIKCLVK